MKKLFIIFVFFMTFLVLSSCVENDESISIIFEVNGGDDLASIKVVKDTTIELPSATKENNIFIAWFWDIELTELVEETPSFYENAILYAKWQEELIVIEPKEIIDITFVLPDNSSLLQRLDNNTTLTDFPETEREGYDLVWFVDELFIHPFNISTLLTDDIILYGNWTAFFVIDVNTIIALSDYGKSQREIYIPPFIDDVEIFALSDNCFSHSSTLEKLTISENIKQIGSSLFSHCENLKEIFVLEENPCFLSIDGVLYNKDETSLIAYPKAKTNWSYKISSETTTISKDAFGNIEGIIELVLPNQISTIEEDAFLGCTATITLSQGMEEIPKNSFSGYAGSHINLSNIVKIGDFAFNKCTNLSVLNLPSSVKEIGDSAFAYGRYPINFANNNGMTILHKGAFRYYDNANISLPNTTREIESEAFRNSSLTSIVLPNSLEKIGKNAFQDCRKLENIFMRNSTVVEIGDDAFYSCLALKSIEISPMLETIGARAFYNCKQLKTLILPCTIKSIGLSAFKDCENLEEVFIYASTPPKLEGASFFPCKTIIYVDNLDAYNKRREWQFLNNKIQEIKKEDIILDSYLSEDSERETR